VDSELEVIHDEMEQTRASLADKLGALENQVRETVSDATDAVHSTVEGVKDVVGTVSETFESVTEQLSVTKQVENNPWLMFGAAVATGFVASQLLDRATSAAAKAVVTPLPTLPAAPLTQSASFDAPKQKSESFLGSMESGAMDALKGMLPDAKEVMNTVTSGVGSLAVGTVMGLIRELAAGHLPDQWKGEVTKLVDQVTEQLGGKPLQPLRREPAQESQAQQGVQAGRQESFCDEKRQEGAPYDPQQRACETGTSFTEQGGSGSREMHPGRIQPSYTG